MIYGEFWDGTLPNMIKKSFINRGFKVNEFDYTNILPGIRERSLSSRIKRRALKFFYEKIIEKKFLKSCHTFKPDVLIVCKGINLNNKVISFIKESSFYSLNWNPDDFFNMKTSSKRLINSLPVYNAILSSRPHMFDKYYNLGAQKVIFSDWYYIPEYHYSLNEPIKRQISFVGSWSKLREKTLSEIKHKVDIWGGGWNMSSESFNKIHNVHMKVLTQREMSIVFSTSRFNLNLLTPDNFDNINLRFFEIPASGGLLVTKKTAQSSEFLKDGEDCIMYDHDDNINTFIDSERKDLDKICQSGYSKIRVSRNTFDSRLDAILAEIALFS